MGRLGDAIDDMGVKATAFIDIPKIGVTEITADAVTTVPFLQRELREIGTVSNPAKTAAIPRRGHIPTTEEIALFASVGAFIAEEKGIDGMGISVDSKGYQVTCAARMVRDGAMDYFVRLVARGPGKKQAALIAAGSLIAKAGYLKGGMGTTMSK